MGSKPFWKVQITLLWCPLVSKYVQFLLTILKNDGFKNPSLKIVFGRTHQTYANYAPEICHICNRISLVIFRVFIRVVVTGAWIPTEIWQRVPGTRLDKSAINSKNFSKTKWSCYKCCKTRFLEERDPTIGPPSLVKKKIGHLSFENPN